MSGIDIPAAAAKSNYGPIETESKPARIPPPELPLILCRATDLACRHVDADRGSVLARIPFDGIGSAVGPRGFCLTISHLCFVAHCRRGGGHVSAPPHDDRYANVDDDARVSIGRADADASNPSLARHGSSGIAGMRQRFRHSGAAVVRCRNGWTGGS